MIVVEIVSRVLGAFTAVISALVFASRAASRIQTELSTRVCSFELFFAALMFAVTTCAFALATALLLES